MRRRKKPTEHVEPDLPITPMLDMSFQLLAFFIMTFKPAPTEGQIAMSLPPAEEGGESMSIPDLTSPKPARFAVRVIPNERGGIASMNIREEGAADAKGRDLGADVQTGFLPEVKKVFQAEQERRDKLAREGQPVPPPPKLTLEIGDTLHQGPVVQLMDAAVQVGFTDIAPVPLDKSKRK
jgi:biopolymer transport protein ExbD